MVAPAPAVIVIMAMARHTVAGFVAGEAGTEAILFREEPASADGVEVGIMKAVFQVLVCGVLFFHGVSGYIVVLGVPVQSGHGQSPVVLPDGGVSDVGLALRNGVVASFDGSFYFVFGWHASRHRLVDHVDRAADGGASVEQGRGAAKDLNALDQ